MDDQVELLQGTLDMLILKAVSLGPLHGYGVLLRIQQISKDRLEIQQGSLYPALYRLEHQGWITSEWGESENKRKQSITGSPQPESGVYKRKQKIGIASLKSSPAFCAPDRRKYEAVESH